MIFTTKCMKNSLELYKSALQLAILHISFSCILKVVIIKLVSVSETKISRCEKITRIPHMQIGNPLLVNYPHIF